MAADILMDAIMGANESPLKRALLDAGIADDAIGYVADSVAQPFAVVSLRGARPGAAERLRAIVAAEARRLAEGGLDRELVRAALSHAEFVMRERNFGYPDGVVLAIRHGRMAVLRRRPGGLPALRGRLRQPAREGGGGVLRGAFARAVPG
ncbi:MAG: hypothetical protein ACLUVF_07940 [Adlercreutzia sp.]